MIIVAATFVCFGRFSNDCMRRSIRLAEYFCLIVGETKFGGYNSAIGAGLGSTTSRLFTKDPDLKSLTVISTRAGSLLFPDAETE